MQCNNSFVQGIKRGVELLAKETADKSKQDFFGLDGTNDSSMIFGEGSC